MGRGEEGVKAGREGAKVERLRKDKTVKRDERRGFSAGINGGNREEEEEGSHCCHCKILVKPSNKDEETNKPKAQM